MRLTTRPALLHWVVAGIVTAIVAVFITFPIAALILPRVPVDHRLAALIGIYVLLWLAAVPLLLRSARAARWGVDLEGLDTPAGRIDFAQVVSAHRGYPDRRAVSAKLLQVTRRPQPLSGQHADPPARRRQPPAGEPALALDSRGEHRHVKTLRAEQRQAPPSHRLRRVGNRGPAETADEPAHPAAGEIASARAVSGTTSLPAFARPAQFTSPY